MDLSSLADTGDRSNVGLKGEYMGFMPQTGAYDISPKPLPGQGPFGKVPGTIGLPPNIYEGVQSVYSGLPGLTSGAGNIIKSQMAGELSPETINRIQDEAAAFGVSSGLPMTQFSGYRGLRNLGLNVEGVQQQGLQNYGNFLSTLGKTVTDPALAAQIASGNAVLNAAPDPEAAFRAQMQAYLDAMKQAAAAGRSPAGGTAPVIQGRNYDNFQNYGGPGMSVGNSLATGLNYGGQEFGPGTSPETAKANWDAWNAAMPWSNAPGDQSIWEDMWAGGAPSDTTFGTDVYSWDPYADLETGYM